MVAVASMTPAAETPVPVVPIAMVAPVVLLLVLPHLLLQQVLQGLLFLVTPSPQALAALVAWRLLAPAAAAAVAAARTETTTVVAVAPVALAVPLVRAAQAARVAADHSPSTPITLQW